MRDIYLWHIIKANKPTILLTTHYFVGYIKKDMAENFLESLDIEWRI